MEFNATKISITINPFGMENSLCFDFDNGYLKILRKDEEPLLYIEFNGKVAQTHVKNLGFVGTQKGLIKFTLYEVNEILGINNYTITVNYYLSDEDEAKMTKILGNLKLRKYKDGTII
jgi:hypothetical protein